MLKKNIFLPFVVLIPCFLFGQFTVERLEEKPLKATRFVGVDAFESYYYVEGDVFYKENEDGRIQFADFTLGTPTTVDILNPLKIILFYQETNTVVVLDNTLNPINRVDFNQVEEPRLVYKASGGGERKLWIFNQDTMQVELWDMDRNQPLITSLPLTSGVDAWSTDYNNVWAVSDGMLLHYNNYGTLLTRNNIAEEAGIANWKGGVLLNVDNKWLCKPKENLTFVPLDIPEVATHQFSINGNILYIYNGTQVTSYHIEYTN